MPWGRGALSAMARRSKSAKAASIASTPSGSNTVWAAERAIKGAIHSAASMDFSYDRTFREESPEAYERLLLDALLGDPTLFIRTDEVEQCWRIVDPIIEHWANDQSPIPTYEAASWGPTDADRLIGRSGRRWRNEM